MNLQSADRRQWVLSFLSYELRHKKTFFFDVSGDVQTDLGRSTTTLPYILWNGQAHRVAR